MSRTIRRSVVDIKAPEGEMPFEEMIAIEERTGEKIPEALNPQLKARCFELYGAHSTFEEISALTGIKKNTIKSWASREHWNEKRFEADEADLKEIIEGKKILLATLVTEILNGTLKAVRRDAKGDGFKPKDINKYLAALGSIEKLSRLSLGQATSISEERTKRANFTLPAETLKQISQVKVVDPFSSSAPTETKDVSNGLLQSSDSPRD